MPELPLASESDVGRPLGAVSASGELPFAVDDSLPFTVETDTIPPFVAVSNSGLYPGETTFPGETALPGAPYEALAPNVAVGALPVAVEADSTSTPVVVAEKPTPTAVTQDMALPLTVLVDDAMFASAIEGIDRTPVFTLKADWGRTGLFDHEFSDLTNLVEEITVERTLTGELPSEVGLVDGTTSATMSVQLAGRWSRTEDDGYDPVDVFAPYRFDSPLYGAATLQSPVQLETGFVTASGPRLDRRFTGTVAQINPASAARTVAMTGLDPAHRLREAITLPGTAMYASILAQRGPDAYRGRFNSQWLIDYILRRNGIFASPPARPDAILSVTGHGSMVPEIGWGGAPVEYYPTFRGAMWVQGPFGPLAFNGQAYGRWWLEEQLTAASGTGFGMSMWLRPWATGQYLSIDLTSDASIFLRFGTNASGQPYFSFFRDGTGATTLTATTYAAPSNFVWRFVGVHVSFAATTMTVRFRVGNQIHTGTATIGSRTANWKPGVSIDYSWLGAVTNFQLWRSATPPGAGQWSGETWTPQADLDPGANELTGIPQILGEDSMELIKEICAAEGSTFEFTEEGRARFRTRVGDAARGGTNDVTERITADRNLADLVSTTDEASVRNIVNVKTKMQLVGDWEDYFQATTVDQFDTPPGTSVFDVPISSNVYEIPESRDAYGVKSDLGALNRASFVFYTSEDETGWSPNWNKQEKVAAIKNYIKLCLVYASNPVEITELANIPTVYIRVTRTNPTTLRIFITNYSTQTVRFATPRRPAQDGVFQEGQPALIIPARLVDAASEQVETYTDNTSVQLYGPSTYDVGNSADRWRQTPEGLRGLATSVLAATARPVPVLDAVDVPHDPRRRLRDRVLIEDPDGLGEVAATVVGLSTTYSTDGATDQLTVRPIAPPGLGLLGDSTVGLLGVNLVLG